MGYGLGLFVVVGTPNLLVICLVDIVQVWLVLMAPRVGLRIFWFVVCFLVFCFDLCLLLCLHVICVICIL